MLAVSCATPPPPQVEAKKEVPKAYVRGEPIPDMTTRRPELVPQVLPARVRYRFSDNAVVNRLADRLGSALSKGDTSVFGNVVMVQPGAWTIVKSLGPIGKKGTGELRIIDPKQGFKNGLESGMAGKILRGSEETTRLANTITAIVAEDGGCEIRALTTDEMAKWWVYIGFDIEEPVYVVASKGRRYKFVISFVKDDKIFIVDELNALPDAK